AHRKAVLAHEACQSVACRNQGSRRAPEAPLRYRADRSRQNRLAPFYPLRNKTRIVKIDNVAEKAGNAPPGTIYNLSFPVVFQVLLPRYCELGTVFVMPCA